MSKAEFDRAMDALLLEVDESIVRDIRRIGHGYAQREAVDFAMWNENMRIDRETYDETYQDWKDELKANSKSKTPPSEQ